MAVQDQVTIYDQYLQYYLMKICVLVEVNSTTINLSKLIHILLSSPANHRNKYNMLEAVTLATPKPTRIRKENSSPPAITSPTPHHILNLDLTPAKPRSKPVIDPDFKTFYNTTCRSWRMSHLRGQQRSGRDSMATSRESVVGTPFTAGQIGQKDAGSMVIPLIDGQHYHYLVKAITGIRKGRLLSEIRYSQTLNPENHRHDKYSKRQIKNQPLTMSLLQPVRDDKEDYSGPKIVNISPQIRSRKGDRRGEKDNFFQKVFKNKAKLQSKYFEEKQSDDECQAGALGEGELTIHQVGWAKRHLRRPAHI